MEELKIGLAVLGTITTPALTVTIWMYRNGIRDIKRDVGKLWKKMDEHISWHLDKG